jgi:hypothetical protein
MFKIIKQQQRPSISVPFYSEINDIYNNEYVSKTFQDKLVKVEQEYSSDNLMLTIQVYWSSRKDVLAYMTDVFCYDNYIIPMIVYDRNNNIKTISIKTEVKDNI